MAGAALTAIGFIKDNDILTIAGIALIVIIVYVFLYFERPAK